MAAAKKNTPAKKPPAKSSPPIPPTRPRKGGDRTGGRIIVIDPNSPAAKHGLSGMQAVFVNEYLADPKLNASAAAEKAGYSNPAVDASRLINQVPAVRACIQEHMDARSERTHLKADHVLLEIGRMAFANMMDYIRVDEEGDAVVDLSMLTRDKAAAISEVTVETYVEGRGKDAERVKRVKFKLADKIRSLELLGKHLKLFGVEANLNSNDAPPPTRVEITVVDASVKQASKPAATD